MENRFYVGDMVHKGAHRRGEHEAIITEAEWERARATPGINTRSATLKALLAGMVSCAACSGPVWTTTTGPTGHRRVSYREPSHLQLRECPSARRMWQSSEPDGQVARIICEMGADTDWLAGIDRQARQMPTVRTESRDSLLEKKRRLGRAYSLGALGDDEFGQPLTRWTPLCGWWT